MGLTTAEAALQLGVTAHEVRRLIAAGDLAAVTVGRQLMVDEKSLHRRVQQRISRGRALAPRSAWAALQECSGEPAGWLDQSSRSRLRRWLRTRNPGQIAMACRRRAERHDLRILPGYQAEIREHLDTRAGGMSAADSAVVDIVSFSEHATEIYCRADVLDHLISDYALTRDGETNLVIRVPTLTTPDVLDRPALPLSIIAVDLLESADVRSRRAGEELLQQQLDEHLG